MKLTRKSGLLAVALCAVGSIAAIAAGSFSTLPIVGGASFCASTVTGTGSLGGITGQGQGSTGSICGQTVPAGPPALTGAERIPADTNLTGGAPPQTVVITTCQLGGGSLSIVSVASGITTDTIANQQCYYIIDGTGTINALTLTMPSAPLDGQILRISAKVAVTTLTMSANTGQTLAGGATSASANAAVGAWIYRQTTASAGNWYRVQ